MNCQTMLFVYKNVDKLFIMITVIEIMYLKKSSKNKLSTNFQAFEIFFASSHFLSAWSSFL